MKKLKSLQRKIIFWITILPLKLLEFTSPRIYMKYYVRLLKFMGLKFYGMPRYISSKCKFDDYSKINIGERLVISANVILLTHDYSITTLKIYEGRQPETDCSIVKGIEFGSNVFVGMNSIILPGSVIGSNVIIGAGTVVRGEIPDNSLVIGNPCRIVSSLGTLSEKWRLKYENETLRYDID